MDSFSSVPSGSGSPQFSTEELMDKVKAQLAQAYAQEFLEVNTQNFPLSRPSSFYFFYWFPLFMGIRLSFYIQLVVFVLFILFFWVLVFFAFSAPSSSSSSFFFGLDKTVILSIANYKRLLN